MNLTGFKRSGLEGLTSISGNYNMLAIRTEKDAIDMAMALLELSTMLQAKAAKIKDDGAADDNAIKLLETVETVEALAFAIWPAEALDVKTGKTSLRLAELKAQRDDERRQIELREQQRDQAAKDRAKKRRKERQRAGQPS